MLLYGAGVCGRGTRYKLEEDAFSNGSPRRAWLFVRNSPRGPVKGVLNLNVEQAKELRDTLNEFIEGF